MTIRRKLKEFRHFMEVDLWRVKVSTLSRGRSSLYKFLRIWMISVSEFKKDSISEKASALTYFSLLSIVPALAIAFGIAKGFGLEKYLARELQRYFAGQDTILEMSLEFTDRMLANANSGVIIGIAFLFILYAVLRLLYMIEQAFNEIWDTKSRTWQRKISDYLAIILLAPIFLTLSGTATVFITGKIVNLASEVEVLGYIQPAIKFGLKIIPYIFMSMLMTILYIIFPNTRVKPVPALVAGVIIGTGFQLTQIAWIKGQVLLSTYSTVYGVFAVLPLFMIYVQLSWFLVLFGAELAFAIQNATEWSYEGRKWKLSYHHKKKLTILIMYHLVKNFENRGNHALSVSELSSLVYIPYRFIKEILRELEKAGLVNKVVDEDESDRYQPGLDIGQIDIHLLLRKMEMKGYDKLKSNHDPKFVEIEKLLQEISEATKSSKGNKLLRDLG